jgi:hypothetical protein
MQYMWNTVSIQLLVFLSIYLGVFLIVSVS